MSRGPIQIGELVKLPETTRTDRRLNEAVEDIFGATTLSRGDLGYLLSLHAHVYLPRKRTAATRHVHANGPYSVLVDAGPLLDPGSKEWIDQPLPYGGKPRALLAFVASYAKRHRAREVPLGDSFTDFVRQMAGSATGGASGSLTLWRKQFSALAAATIRVGVAFDGQATIRKIDVAEQIEVWFAREPGQMSLFPSSVTLTGAYYDLIQNHAMPIDWRAFRALQGDPLALDTYLWLTYRLPRVRERGGRLIPWGSLHAQFGPEYSRLRDFRRYFTRALGKAIKVYPSARVDVAKAGVVVKSSPPAVARRQSRVVKIADLAP